MNERFKELAKQTDVWCDQNYTGSEFYDVRWEEKFAQLIVQECIEISQVGSITAGKLKLHFGIEE